MSGLIVMSDNSQSPAAGEPYKISHPPSRNQRPRDMMQKVY